MNGLWAHMSAHAGLIGRPVYVYINICVYIHIRKRRPLQPRHTQPRPGIMQGSHVALQSLWTSRVSPGPVHREVVVEVW